MPPILPDHHARRTLFGRARGILAFAIFAAGATAVGCSDDAALPTGSNESALRTATDDVSPALARAVAETFHAREGARRTTSVTTAVDATGRPALYGVDLEGGGWVIVSASLLQAPVLAFAEEGTVDVANLQDGPKEWAAGIASIVEHARAQRSPGVARTDDAMFAEALASGWRPLLLALRERPDVATEAATAASYVASLPEAAKEIPSGDDVCFDCTPQEPTPKPSPGPTGPTPACSVQSWAVFGNVLPTTWDQGCQYNWWTPATNNAGYCFHSPTGCGPTAAAQVVRRWQRAWGTGSTYNWGSMPNQASGTLNGMLDRNRLMYNIGVIAGTNYGDTASGTSRYKLADAFEKMGYYSSVYPLSDSTRPVLYDNLKKGRPVVMRGAGASGEHLWVADEYRFAKFGPANCGPVPISPPYVHFNWGWGGSQDAWYADTKNPLFTHSLYFITAIPK